MFALVDGWDRSEVVDDMKFVPSPLGRRDSRSVTSSHSTFVDIINSSDQMLYKDGLAASTVPDSVAKEASVYIELLLSKSYIHFNTEQSLYCEPRNMELKTRQH